MDDLVGESVLFDGLNVYRVRCAVAKGNVDHPDHAQNHDDDDREEDCHRSTVPSRSEEESEKSTILGSVGMYIITKLLYTIRHDVKENIIHSKVLTLMSFLM